MSRLSAEPDEIVFEDLHGVSDDESGTLEIDLDAKDDTGITRRARTSTDEGTPTGDEDLDSIDYGSGKAPRAGDKDDGEGDEGTQPRDKFSKKFEDRLERERRAKRREAKARADAEAENTRLRAQLKKAKSSGGSDKIADLDRQVADIEAQLEQAIEKGETKEHVRLTSRLTDLKAEKIAARYTADDDSDDDLGDDPPARTKASPRNELVGEWKDTHADWYGRGGFERQTRLANRIDREVFADGYSPDDEEYYEELNRRLQEKMPEMFDDDSGSGSKEQRGQRRTPRDKGRSPVAAADDASRDSAPRKPTGNKVELGPTEFANMRRFGLDPKNPAHVKEYALNKRQADAEEAANG